jgi:hypothetical protein
MTDHERSLHSLVFAAKQGENGLKGRGWALYRDMARGRLRDLVTAAFPKTRNAIGTTTFEELFVKWLDETPPTSPYFRDAATEYSEWLRTERAMRDGSLESDLLALETFYWTLSYEDVVSPDFGPLDFESPLATNATLKLVRFAHPVHRDDAEITPSDTRLALARRRDTGVVVWKELSEFEWLVLQKSAEKGVTLVGSVRDAAAELGREVDEELVRDLATRLEVLLASDIVLGSVP